MFATVSSKLSWVSYNLAMAQRRKLHDQYFKLAKAQGYLARSAYKLIEIDDRFKLFGTKRSKPIRVLDVGCAPGSWLQVAAQRCPPSSSIVGIDLKAITHPMPSHISTLVGDIEKTDPRMVREAAGGWFDLVLSDMAPNTTGHGDDSKSAHLCRSLLDLLPGLLGPRGNFAMKILEGQEYRLVLGHTKKRFREARGFKPKASRDASREIYIIGKSFLQNTPTTTPTPTQPQPTTDSHTHAESGR